MLPVVEGGQRPTGTVRVSGATATSPHPRSSMAALVTAQCAEGRSIVKDAHTALRGYNDLEGKLAALGVNGLKVHETGPVALVAAS